MVADAKYRAAGHHYFVVSCSHKVSKYALKSVLFEVRPEPKGFYTHCGPIGCSKTYPTPQECIAGLLKANDCNSIHINPVD